jgi:hypothetical protein
VKAGQRLQRALVASYPPTFRRRYGAELTSLVEDNDARWRDSVDLALGVGRAWVAPVFGGTALEQRRSRLQTTTITVLAAWCASLLGAGAFSKAVDDPPLPGLHGAALTAYDVGTIVVEATAAAVLLAGFAFWLTVIVPALRARRRDVAWPALAPALIVGVWLGITGLVALFAQHIVRHRSIALSWPRGASTLIVFLAWGAVTVVCVAGCAATAAVALRRADIEIPRLRVSTFVAGLATVGIAAQAAASVVCMATLLHARDAGGVGPRDLVFSAGSVVVVVVVTAVAGVSVARGLGAIRGPSTT